MAITVVNLIEKDNTTTANVVDRSPVQVDVIVSGGIINTAEGAGTLESLDDINDVTITNVQGGDGLFYNSVTNKWENTKTAHKHFQNNSSTTWSITHNLNLENYLPTITVKLTEGAVYNDVQAMGIVTYINQNQLTINFLQAKSGYAYIKK